MKILVKAKPGAKFERIEPAQAAADSSHRELPCFKVSVSERAADGKANGAIVRLVAKHFGISAHSVRIVSGHTATQKIVEIRDE